MRIAEETMAFIIHILAYTQKSWGGGSFAKFSGLYWRMTLEGILNPAKKRSGGLQGCS